MTRNIGIVPIKSYSKRIPNKNFKDLNGKPLWRWTFDVLVKSNIFDYIFLSSDKPDLLKLNNSKNIKLIKRKEELCKSNIHASEVIFDILQNHDYKFSSSDNIMMFLPTSPFRSTESIKKASRILKEGFSSVIGISKASKGSNSYRILNKDNILVHTCKEKDLHRQSTDINEFIVSGSIFASKLNTLLKYRTFHQPDTYGLLVNESESIDINTELDFLTAQAYLNKFNVKY